MKLSISALCGTLFLATPCLAQFTLDPGTLIGVEADAGGAPGPWDLLKYNVSGGIADTLTLDLPTIPVGSAVIAGEVYTVDIFGGVYRIDLTTGLGTFQFTAIPQIVECMGHRGQELLLHEWNTDVIYRYSVTGNLLGTIQLSVPVQATGLDASSTRIYMAEWDTGALLVFDMQGNLLQNLDPGVGGFAYSGLGYDATSDSVWVATGFSTDLVLQLDNNGNTLSSFPTNIGVLNSLDYVGGDGLGSLYCTPAAPNSTGMAGTLSALGSIVAADNLFQLTAGSLPEGQFGYFIASQTQGFIPGVGGGQGNLCLASQIARFTAGIGQVTGGTLSLQVDLTDVPEPPTFSKQVLAGETWNFQCWHRDLNPGPTNNLTPGLSVTFQ